MFNMTVWNYKLL